jgi:hypothetical protein
MPMATASKLTADERTKLSHSASHAVRREPPRGQTKGLIWKVSDMPRSRKWNDEMAMSITR